MKKLLFFMLALSISLAQVARAENDNQRKRHKRAPEEHQAAAPSARPAAPVQRRATIARPATPVKSEANLDGRTHQATVTTSNVVNTRPTRSFNRDSFAVARTHVVRVAHPAWWWRARYPHTTFVLFGGGYYYWWGGYWYPAYGYSPIYNSYTYSEPVYGYNNLEPGQVIENVQVALRDQGYYPGTIDGLVGTQTRSALAAYQRDHGLVVTSAIDQPTLVTLGLT